MDNKINAEEVANVLIGLIRVGVALLLIWLTQALWNGVITDITGFKAITYWQAVLLTLFLDTNPWRALAGIIRED